MTPVPPAHLLRWSQVKFACPLPVRIIELLRLIIDVTIQGNQALNATYPYAMQWTKAAHALTILLIVRTEFYMATATITSKGQTTIPKEVRAAANLKPGDRIHFAVLEDGTIIVRVKNRSIRDLAFKPPGGKRVSIAQMNR